LESLLTVVPGLFFLPRRRPVLAAASLACALAQLPLSPDPAWAHALDSSLERVAGLNRTLELQSQFSSGEPAAGARVSLVAPDGASLPLGSTDPHGRLRFTLPAAADAAWEVRVDQGPGHRDYLELPAAPAPASAQASRPGRPLARLGAAVDRAAGPLLLLGALVWWPRRRGAG